MFNTYSFFQLYTHSIFYNNLLPVHSALLPLPSGSLQSYPRHLKLPSKLQEPLSGNEKFFPELKQLSAEYKKQSAEIKKSSAKCVKSHAEIEKSSAEYKKLSAEIKRSSAECVESHAKLEKSSAEYKKLSAELKQLSAEYMKSHPGFNLLKNRGQALKNA